VPKKLEKLSRELLLDKPIGGNSDAARSIRGPRIRNARQDLLIRMLIRALQAYFEHTDKLNDARGDDPDFPDSALEIIRHELSTVEPKIVD